MPSKSTITASLTPELTDFIATKLATGHYRSASEVIRAGLRALDKEEQRHPERQTEAPDVDLSFLDESEIGRLARTFDWSRTSIGPISTWPQSLKTTVGMILRSPVPIVLLWGPDGVMIYNDAYSVFAGGRHPLLFGSKVREGWPEVADFNDNVMKVGLSGGTLSYRDQELTLHRKGFPEQVWMNLDYSPVLDESGQPAGVLAVVVETTERVQAERTLARTEERLSYALNAAGMIGTFDWHIPTDTLYSDARFAAMFSVDPQKGATGAPISVYFAGIHPNDRERIGEAVNHAIATREKYTQEYRLLQRDGTVRWIEARGECLYDEQGEPLRFPGTAVDITERKRVESVLRESEARFRNLADNSPVMVWVTEPDASCTYLSRSWYEFTGQTPETGLGLGWLDATHPDDKAEAERIYLAANERREAFQIEYRLRRADGTYRWAIDAAAPRFSEEGEFLGYVGSVIDITDRKEAEDTLRDSEQRIRELLEALPAAVYTTDAEGRITFYNQAAVELSGRRPVLGSDQWCVSWKLYWSDGTPLPHDQCPMAMSLKEDRPIRGMEAIAERPDGTRVPFIPYPMPLHDASGKLIGAVNMLVDITDRKKAEDALHASEERLQAIFSQTTGGIALGDMTGRFTMVNQRYCDLVGYTEAELMGLRMQDITHPDDLPGNAVLFQRLAETGESFVIEKRYLRKDGSHVWVNNSVAPIRNAAGEVQQVVAVAIEIEALKEAQERQHLLLRELNHRVKNLFAIASGMVALSARSAKTPQEMAQILQGRLNALARANDLIRPGLVGTEADQEATTMEKLIRAVLLPYVDEARARDRECIILNGPAVPVAGDAVTSLALVLHETATNAAKYGALSAPEGRIRVDWKVKNSNLHLRWEEIDGPIIAEPPQGHGFGSNLVKRSVTGQLQGQIEYDWRSEGLTVHVTVPIERLNQ